jgi:gliding motility-associated-like protein
MANLVIIDTVTGFSYNHILEDSTLTGCYAIQGIDVAGNLGDIQLRTCVEDCPDYELPTAFTPNGDGKNDIYTPIIPYQLVLKVDMKIYNRWGNLVFETTDPNINWDGTDMNSGKPLETAVFFYVCKLFINSLEGLREVEKPLDGYIHLYR